MSTIEIEVQDIATAEMKRQALQKLSDKLTVENLKFLSELADKPKVNEKIQSKKLIIKSALWVRKVIY